MSPSPELLYYIVEDFIKLSYLQKFNMGIELKLIAPEDVHYSEDQLEETLLVRMWQKNMFSEFANLLYTLYWT